MGEVQLLKGQEIPQDSQYFFHIEALKETTDFNSTISLDSDTEIASTPQKQESAQTYREIPQNPAVTPNIPSQSIPPKQSVIYYGSKGEYTVNYQARTYYECVYGTGCLSLEKEKNRLFVTCYGSIGGHKSTKSLSGKRFN